MKIEEQNLNEVQKPQLNIGAVMGRFGECKYSCELTHDPSWFHTIKIKDFSIYIQEWIDNDDNKFFAAVFIGDKKNANGLANSNLDLLLNDIEKIVKNVV